MVAKPVPSFDPNPSLSAVVGFLQEIGVTDFALIGRVATWLYLPEEVHQFTKDVDVAVLSADIAKIEQGLKAKGYTVYQLPIGGVAVRQPAFYVDFIDRRTDGLDQLFSEAIAKAQPGVVVNDVTMPLVRLDHLITMKLVSGTPKDDLDVRALLKVDGIHYPDLRKLVWHHLGVGTANRLDAFAREAGLLPPRTNYDAIVS